MLPVQERMRAAANPQKAEFLQRFFKTGPGQYAEGDLFLGLTVPQTRALLPLCRDMDLTQLLELLHSAYHEERLLALLCLGKRGGAEVYRAYLDNTRWVNNWDLVDSSASQIVGAWLLERERSVLDRLAHSALMWERRIAVIATFAFIRRGQLQDTLRLCEVLLGDSHDLMHKACGWMLREVGKRDPACLEGFLNQHAAVMPRTMLRYALEKMPSERRRYYMEQRNLTSRDTVRPV